MNVLLISQCSKRALVETRRVLDQFAERRGDRVWQTAITQQGLDTLRKMLKKNARRNTAVICHWIHGKNRSDVLWVVGNPANFNIDGAVPTNTTRRDILRADDENNWHYAQVISLLSGIAGLFHDFGKANTLFQRKLKTAKATQEPYRHEWVSLRLFQAFVGHKNDREWLQALADVTEDDDARVLGELVTDSPGKTSNPFKSLPPVAKVVAWLIVSHHRLPRFEYRGGGASNMSPKVEAIDHWLTGFDYSARWNSPQFDKPWSAKDLKEVWELKQGTPLRSKTWRSKAASLASRALKLEPLFNADWLENRFVAHMARMSLMLADHVYSAQDPSAKWQDKKYKAYANTDRKTRERKQKLDEHNVGVGHNAYLFARALPEMRHSLPSITRHPGFKKRSANSRFRWQDKAYDLAVGLRKSTEAHGFFGINMASTGKGKTFANARIMYGLADEQLGCRFNIALGLRTLTLQTGDAIRERLGLGDDDLAIKIGSAVVRELHEQAQREKPDAAAEKNQPLAPETAGSESVEGFFETQEYVRYEGTLDDSRFSHWLSRDPNLHQLVSAPILVSTIDHLMPATEGERGGKQIAPMLRLMSSDLVLDEPDDFGLEDLPALCRLVNWAGLLGARVLLSSATLPPSLTLALFKAYAAGRKVYVEACGEPGKTLQINCAWFDEFSATSHQLVSSAEFETAHVQFVEQRLAKLAGDTPPRLLDILPVASEQILARDSAFSEMAAVIYDAVHLLHQRHHQSHSTGKAVSIGLVRMANIDPLVAVAREFVSTVPQPDCRIHFLIYHSRHPLLIRSKIERELDAVLARHDEDALWEMPSVKHAIDKYPEKSQIFVVLGTAVVEVGRDHDYDWAVVEPSSMRSIIQLAGRVQRHRQKIAHEPNILLLDKNSKGLTGRNPVFTKPGFETAVLSLNSSRLSENLELQQYQHIDAAPRILERAALQPTTNLVDLEHTSMRHTLFGSGDQRYPASLWWEHEATWCAEIQHHTRFRNSPKDEQFVLLAEDEGDPLLFYQISEKGDLLAVEKEQFQRPVITTAAGVQPWLPLALDAELLELADSEGRQLHDVCMRYTQIRLVEHERAECPHWQYEPVFGVFRALD